MISLHGHVLRGALRLDFDLDIEPGVSFVVGPNGAGKTTLLRVLAGLEALDDGELVAAHRRPVAMAFQDHRLFPHLTVLDNVAFPARRRGTARHDARAAARPHLESVGIGDIARRRPRELSVGQQQRAAIARALATPAALLLLDEPLAAIDDASRTLIRSRLHAATHPTIVWVSHDPTDVGADSRRISVDGGFVRQTLGS
jgi:molybdate transport system ATP-binding protein